MVKNLPAMWETWVLSLGQEDPLRKTWQPTPVVLPGESHGQRSLVGYSPWGHKELDITECLTVSLSTHNLIEIRTMSSGSDDKESTCNAGDLGVTPGSGRSPGGGHGSPLQSSYLEHSHGQRSLGGYSPWCGKESDTTEWLSIAHEFL